MQPASAETALRFAASYYGKSFATEQAFLLSKVNAVRRLLWKQKASRENLFRVNGCECVQVFRDPCGGPRCQSFHGITLPSGVEGVSHLEYNGCRIDVTNKTLANGIACQTRCAGPYRAEIEGKDSVLKSAIPTNYRSHISVQCLDAKDKGKRAGVEYVNLRGAIIREDIVLATDGNETSHPVGKFVNVTFPERCGTIRVMTRDGYSLGEYPWSVISPQHRLIHINGIATGATVNWWGLKCPAKVRYLTDMVEMDDETDWRTAFMWLELHSTEGRSGAQDAAYQSAYQYLSSSAEAELQARQTTPMKGLQPQTVIALSRKMRAFR